MNPEIMLGSHHVRNSLKGIYETFSALFGRKGLLISKMVVFTHRIIFLSKIQYFFTGNYQLEDENNKSSKKSSRFEIKKLIQRFVSRILFLLFISIFSNRLNFRCYLIKGWSIIRVSHQLFFYPLNIPFSSFCTNLPNFL